jgi:aspartate racemase
VSGKDRVIGVLGGMGPEATLAFYSHIVSATPAGRDQDHLRVIIDSNPGIPDRTAAILGEGESPVPAMAAGIDALQRAGADFVVIPCVSAHAFIDELKGNARLPVLSVLDVVAEAVQQHPLRLGCLGLLATTGTVRAGMFQRCISGAGLEVLLPNPEDQARVQASIYAVKAGAPEAVRREITGELRNIVNRMVSAGAEGIVLGCTEIPLVLGQADVAVPVFDSLQLLARAAIRAAGRAPIVLESLSQGRNQ